MELVRIAVVHAPSARRYARLTADDLDLHRTDRQQFRADTLDPNRSQDLRALATRPYRAVVLLLSHDLDLTPTARKRIHELHKDVHVIGLRVDEIPEALALFAADLHIHVGRSHEPLNRAAEYEMRITLGILCSSTVAGLLLLEWATNSDAQKSFLHYRGHKFGIDTRNLSINQALPRETELTHSTTASRLYGHIIIYRALYLLKDSKKFLKDINFFVTDLLHHRDKLNIPVSLKLLNMRGEIFSASGLGEKEKKKAGIARIFYSRLCRIPGHRQRA